MLTTLRRAGYRVAYPIAMVVWFVTRARHRGAKCLLEYGGEVLLVRHTYGDRRSWDLPGGFVARGEEPAAAARRELREELAVEVGDLRELGSVEMRIGGRHDHVHFFHARLDSPALRRNAAELAEVRWFAPAALPRPLGRHVRKVLALRR